MEKNVEGDINEPNEIINKGVNEKHEQQLKWVIVGIAFLFIFIIFFYFIYNSSVNFDYAGTKFQKVRFGNLIFYQISFPLYTTTGKHVNDYNIYFRNDPRQLRNIPVEGDINLEKNMIINADQNLLCGDNNIAMANFIQFYKGVVGMNIIANNSYTCGKVSGASIVKFLNSSETKIEKTDTNCYTLYVNNCAVLNVSERFMIATIAQSNNAHI